MTPQRLLASHRCSRSGDAHVVPRVCTVGLSPSSVLLRTCWGTGTHDSELGRSRLRVSGCPLASRVPASPQASLPPRHSDTETGPLASPNRPLTQT